MYEMHIMVFVLSQFGHMGAFPMIDRMGPYMNEAECEARETHFHEVVDEALIEVPGAEVVQFVWTDCQLMDEQPEAFAGDVVG